MERLNSKATNHVSSINGVSGTGDITNMWKDYFENLYSAKVDSKYRQIFESKLLNNSADTSDVLLTVHDVISAINKQKFYRLLAQMVYRWKLLFMDVTVCMCI